MSIDTGLKDINNRIPKINEGGCGVFAILLWNELRQLDIWTRPIAFMDKKPVWSLYHVALKYDGYYFDSDGVHEEMTKYGYNIEECMPLDVLQVEASDEALWSSGFDRAFIPNLRSELRTLGFRVLTQKREMDIMATNF